jgi:hypothetical protein
MPPVGVCGTKYILGYRPVPTAIQDGPIQRFASVEEQGGGQDLWQVLSRSWLYYTVLFWPRNVHSCDMFYAILRRM